MDKQEEIQDLNKAMPYLRTGVALLIYLVRSKQLEVRAPEEDMIDASYRVADIFLHKLTLDVSK